MAAAIERTRLMYLNIMGCPDIEDVPPDVLPLITLAEGEDWLTGMRWEVATRSPLTEADLKSIAQADIDHPNGWGAIVYAVVTADGGPSQALQLRCAHERDAVYLAGIVHGAVRDLGPSDQRQSGLFAA